MTSNFTRRTALGALGAGAMLLPFTRPAAALTEAKAKSLVDKMVVDINKIIASGKSESAMYRDFERVFVKYGDVPTIARYTLGAAARTASRSDLNSYTKAFQGYISRKYGRRFREFIGGRLEVQGARPVKSFIEVRTMAFLRGEDPFEVTFLVSDRSGSDKFFNMFIEGVNMLLTERSEIGAMLDRRGGSIPGLIKDMNAV